MKAKFLALAALVLGLASCQTEPEGLDVVLGGEVDATICVEIPEAETRAMDSAQGIFGTDILAGDATMRYILEIYHNGELAKERQVRYGDGTEMAFPVRLVPGRAYDFVVWADVVTAEGAGDNHYVTTDGLTNITLNGAWNAMDETRDAFTGVMTVETFSNSSDISFDLIRPFAKLRVRTTDIKDVLKLGIVPTTATVEYTTDHRQSFNARTVEYGAADLDKTQNVDYRVVSYEVMTDVDTYTLFADYFFANNDIVNFTLEVKDADEQTIGEKITFNTAINVRRNYLTTITGNLLTDAHNVNVEIKPGFDGETGEEDGKTFARVDTAEEFIDAFNKGVEKIILDGDINLNDILSAGTLSTTRANDGAGITIKNDQTLTLDLNGFTISQSKTQTAAYSMLVNQGTLTITDSQGNGKLAYTDLGNGGEYVSNTIQNSGTLTIDGGTIENNTNTNAGYPHPIDNSGKLVINGGTFTSNANYSSIRIWCDTDDDTEVIINGGTFNGCIDLHNVSARANKGVLTINGGTFNADTYTNSAVRLLGFGNDVDEIFGYINGGTFNGKIKLNNYAGGEFNSQVFFIVGGSFSVDPSEFVVPGYKAEEENGVYVVRKPQALIDFENAIANGDDITLSEDITLMNPVVVEEGKEVTINLNGKTLDIYTHKSVGAVLKNNGTLAIEGGTISSLGDNGGSAIANNGILTVKNATLNGAPNAGSSWPSYTVNNTGTMTLENTTITSKHGSVASYDGGVLTLNNCTIDMAGIPGFTSHGIYTYDGGKVIVNGGTYENKATDQNSTGGSVINGYVEVNAGTFTGRIQNYYGTPVLKGGTYSVKPNNAFVAEGYKVIEENGKYNVVPNDVDDVVSSTETLDEAIEAGNDTIALNAGVYVIPVSASGKTIAFVGTGAPEDTLITAQNDGAAEGNCDYSLRGSKATFENVTITTTGTYFPGYAGCQGTYKNCIINGVFTLYDNSSFENCTFNISGDLYNVWTWGAAEATFTNCTFNCDGKAMLLYGQANTKLTMNNCVFNDNGSISGKAAIEIGNDYNTSYELTVNEATVNGFDINPNGFVTGTTLWANKSSMPASKLKVTVDGKNAYNYVAAADDTQSFTDAIANGATEVILSAGNYTMPEPDLRGKTLTITGTKDAVIDAAAVDSRDQFVTGATLVFDGVTINFGKVNYMGFANTASLTYKNCKINGLQFLFGDNVTFENCEFDSNGAEHSVWTYGCKNVTFTECDFTYGDRCVNCYNDNDVEGGQTVNFTNCAFSTENTASQGAVEINSCFITDGIEVNLKGCTAPDHGELAYVSPWDSTNGANTTINIE